MIVLGIDPGVTVGIAVIEVDAGGWSLLERQDLRPTDDTRGEQLFAILKRLGFLLDYYTPSRGDDPVIAMEEMLAYRARTADEKVEAQAIVKLFSAAEPCQLETYAPTTVRSAVMGSGRATPAEIKATMRYLCRMGKTSKKGEAFTVHQQDALAVALCHALRSGALQVLDRCKEA